MNPIDALLPLPGCPEDLFRPDLVDDRYPDMVEWGKAGVRDGIPTCPEPVLQLPGTSTCAEIQTAINALEQQEGGCLQLEPGHYVIDTPLYLKSGVRIRGPYVDAVKLEIRMRGTFPGWESDRVPLLESAIRFDGIHQAGLEHLTLVFDETTPRIFGVRHQQDPFSDRPYDDRDSLFVNTVWVNESHDCFLQFCRFIDSGSNPLVIRNSSHITVRYCELHGAHMRSGGQAYLRVTGSQSCLLNGLVFRDLRHLSIMDGSDAHPCRGNVVIGCDMEVDINFHSGDSGHNLIQDCRIRIPSWHWWSPFAIGVKGTHRPPGPGNLIYRCNAERLRFATLPRTRMAEDPDTVYRIRDSFENEIPLISEAGPAPVSGTLFPRELSRRPQRP